MKFLSAFKPTQVVVVVALLAFGQTVFADPVVDQSQTSASGGGLGLFPNLYGWDRSVSLWQSFTAGLTGNLVGIDLGYTGTLNALDLNIYSGVGVDGTLLSTTALSDISGSGGFVEFTLASALAETAGQTYTFSLENIQCPQGSQWTCGGFNYANTDAYPGGEFMAQGYYEPDQYNVGVTTASATFETLVEPGGNVPEPATLPLVAFALTGLGLIRRAKRV